MIYARIADSSKETSFEIHVLAAKVNFRPHGEWPPGTIRTQKIQTPDFQRDELQDVTKCPSDCTLHPKDQPTQTKILAFKSELTGF
jgi:hypothetical protein